MTIWLLGVLATLWLLIIYHHLVYPIIMLRLQNQADNLRPLSGKALQHKRIAILVPAFNEADVIEDKIRNVACLDYPADKLKLIIACDGCQDNTAHLARKAAAEWQNETLDIQVLEFRQNHGKVALLNKLVPQLQCDIVALSDASALISLDALHIANRHFEQASVGVVAATYKLLNPGSEGERNYWEYQVNIKRGESTIGSPVGVHGALYFFRKSLFRPLPADTINDDFILPMEIVSRGYKALYDCNLIALELEQASLQMDQKRRIRIAAGNFQQLLRLPQLFSPALGGTAFSYISGKALRALMPLILLAQLLLCAWLAQESFSFLILTLIQLGGIVLARLSLFLTGGELPEGILFKPFKLVFYLINGYYSGLIGTLRYLLGLDRGHWRSVSKS